MSWHIIILYKFNVGWNILTVNIKEVTMIGQNELQKLAKIFI